MAKPAEGALGTVEAVFGAMFLDGDDARTAMSSHRKQAFDRLWELQETDGPRQGWLAVGRSQPGSVGEPRVRLLRCGARRACARTDARGLSTGSRKPGACRLTDCVSRESAVAATPARSAGAALGVDVDAVVDLAWLAECAHRGDLRAPAAGRRVDHRVARAVDGASGRRRPPPAATPMQPLSPRSCCGAPGCRRRIPGWPRRSTGCARARIPATGAWPAVSMNKRYPEGSMPSLFMQDAATAFAALALIESEGAPRR